LLYTISLGLDLTVPVLILKAEHREILEQALRVTRRVPLSEALMKIPPSDKDGDDRDFERQEGVPFVNPFSS